LHDIGNVHGKATLVWSVGVDHTLEINFFYDLSQEMALAARPTTASVALLGKDWDYDMASGASVPRQWDDSFEKQFLKPGVNDKAPGDETAEPLDWFLSWVNWIQKILDVASDNGDKTAGEEGA
jgi:hypothetical protein